MPIDPSIPLGVRPVQIESPVNALARVLQIRGMQQEQELGDLKADEYRRSVAEGNALRAALSGGADPYNALLKAGRVKEATEFQKGQSETAEKQAKATKDTVEAQNRVIGIYRDAIAGVNDPQTAADFLRTMHTDPRLKDSPISRVPLEQVLAQIPTDPNAFGGWKQQFALGATKFMELNKPTITTRNLGGTTDTIATEGLTGATRTINSAKNTQSPDNAATVAATMRGQNMTDARAREANALTREANATVYDPERGVLVNKATAQARPATTTDGTPLPPKTSEKQKNELMSISQQRAVIDGAIDAVAKTPRAFGTVRGLATLAGTLPESTAGKFVDTDAERQARSYVFNNVSKVINERAGAAQSVQELARLRAFLPAETDNADQIVSKFQAFKTYLDDLERGTRGQQAPAGGRAPSNLSSAIDAELKRRGVKP